MGEVRGLRKLGEHVVSFRPSQNVIHQHTRPYALPLDLLNTWAKQQRCDEHGNGVPLWYPTFPGVWPAYAAAHFVINFEALLIFLQAAKTPLDIPASAAMR